MQLDLETAITNNDREIIEDLKSGLNVLFSFVMITKTKEGDDEVFHIDSVPIDIDNKKTPYLFNAIERFTKRFKELNGLGENNVQKKD